MVLALHLGVSSTEITSSFNDNTTVGEAADHILTTWLHAQNDRREAYTKMGAKLVNENVKLNLIAHEVLDFRPKSST